MSPHSSLFISIHKVTKSPDPFSVYPADGQEFNTLSMVKKALEEMIPFKDNSIQPKITLLTDFFSKVRVTR